MATASGRQASHSKWPQEFFQLASRGGKRAQKTPNTTKSWGAEQKNPRIPPVAAAAPWSCEVARLLLLIAYLIIRGGPGEMEEGENLARTIPTSNPDPDQEQGGLGVWCGVKVLIIKGVRESTLSVGKSRARNPTQNKSEHKR